MFLIFNYTKNFVQASSSTDKKFCCKIKLLFNTNLTSLILMKKGLPKTLYCWGFLWPFPWRCRQGLYTFLFSKVHQAMNETSIKGKKSLKNWKTVLRLVSYGHFFSVQSRSCVWLESSMQMLWIIIVNVDNS